MTPDFDLLSFAHASRLGCLALRLEQQLYLVIANPFDPHLNSKIDFIISEVEPQYHAIWAIAHHQDIQAYLAHHEMSLRALDGLHSDESTIEQSQSGIEDISLRSINEDTSPAS